MPTVSEPDETMHLTLTLPKVVAEHLRNRVATGIYANESECVEAMLLSETTFEPVDQDALTHWINTEGVRRVRAVQADPSLALSAEEVFDFLDDTHAEGLGREQ